MAWVYAEPFLDIPTGNDRVRLTVHGGLAALVAKGGGSCSSYGHRQLGPSPGETGTPVSCDRAAPAIGIAWNTSGGTPLIPHLGVAVGFVL